MLSLILICTIILLLNLYLNRKWGVLKQWNVPHDPPSLRNLGNRDTFSEGYFTKELENKRKYGPVWGYYSLTTPRLVIHDLELAHQICIKEFPAFPVRLEHGTQLSGKEVNNGLNVVKGKQWKRIRTTLAPAFSQAKLKRMAAIIDQAADNTLRVFQIAFEKNNGCFNTMDVFSRLSLDVICSAAFSTKVNSQDGTKEEPLISQHARTFFRSGFNRFANLLIFAFPLLEPLFVWTSGHKQHIVYFRKLCEQMMTDTSKDTEHGHIDLMRLMIDSRISNSEIENGAQKGLSKIEILGNAMTMLLAGYETTGSAMTYFAYNLALHSDVQRKLQFEIDNVISEGQNIDYAAIKDMKYLDKCIKENLRLYCPVARVLRTAKHDTTVGGLYIPRGVMVAIPVYANCHDPEYWDDPMEFKPDRMEDLSRLNQMAFMPFGAGPRNCIGSKFALMEMKLVFSKILRHFSIKPTNDTPKPPLEMTYFGVTRPKVSFKLCIVPRS